MGHPCEPVDANCGAGAIGVHSKNPNLERFVGRVGHCLDALTGGKEASFSNGSLLISKSFTTQARGGFHSPCQSSSAAGSLHNFPLAIVWLVGRSLCHDETLPISELIPHSLLRAGQKQSTVGNSVGKTVLA